MSTTSLSLLVEKLSKPISFFNIKLWILIVFVFSFVTLVIITLFLYYILSRRRKFYKTKFPLSETSSSKLHPSTYSTSSLDRRLLSRNISECEMKSSRHGPVMSAQWSTRSNSNMSDVESFVVKDAWRKMFSLKEIEVATNGFSRENVIGNGDYGTVYCGVLLDSTRVAVKKLLINSCQAEEFIAQVEAIGHVRHKNLVKLLGYCLEGAQRMLVFEYIDNKNLQHWLHECPQQINPLSWSSRMNIIQGIAKGLAYLHEGIEQKILHRSLKSSNIMLDHQWNPKITDFGLANLFGAQWGFIIMDALGYLAVEHDASPEVFSERHDVYSFGILIMEIITGRTPIDHSESQPYLVDWLKSMVASEQIDDVVDPSLPELPCSIELKRILLIALRCVDPDEGHRPSMGNVVHMLQPRDLLLGDEEIQFLSSI